MPGDIKYGQWSDQEFELSLSVKTTSAACPAAEKYQGDVDAHFLTEVRGEYLPSLQGVSFKNGFGCLRKKKTPRLWFLQWRILKNSW